MAEEGRVDWAMGELLAYASLLTEGHSVRISGQDSIRGTFSHRHAAMVIEDTDQQYSPLKNLSADQARFEIYNSPLNEYGVLGFEYGYALATPASLTIWEAQFGDFANVGQVIVDQYISSAEEKWGLMNGLVMFLPHGFEGQGPEHSSARLERFLVLAARGNMQIVNPTTPANLFHLLRLQLKRNFRVPVIVFTPKSLLRHPQCISDLGELEHSHFSPVIDDDNADVDEVRRLVLCSGKIYYDLLASKEEFNARDIALVRVEQLHPFPKDEIGALLSKYKNNLLTLWVQEEPENMGAWYYIQNMHEGQRDHPCHHGSPAEVPQSACITFMRSSRRKSLTRSSEGAPANCTTNTAGFSASWAVPEKRSSNSIIILKNNQKINQETTMAIEIKVPSPGESITEVEIGSWFVKTGDHVEKDQEIGEIESEKATLPLMAEESGEITLLKEEGETVPVGTVVCTIDTSKAGAATREAVPEKPAVSQEKVAEEVSAADGKGPSTRNP